jgi:AAA+ ATPase superfamily predicted ATPase
MFSSSVPVTARTFFDRSNERERIRQAITRLRAGAPQWLCLVGPRKVGKTSLLLEVAREMKDAAGIGFVVADVFDTMPVSLEFFRILALQVLDVVLAAEAGTSLRSLVRDPASYRAALAGTPSFAKLPQ